MIRERREPVILEERARGNGGASAAAVAGAQEATMTTRGLGDGEDDKAEEDRIAGFGARLGLGRKGTLGDGKWRRDVG